MIYKLYHEIASKKKFTKHDITNEENEERNNQVSYKCEKCQFETKSEESLDNHKKVKHREKLMNEEVMSVIFKCK